MNKQNNRISMTLFTFAAAAFVFLLCGRAYTQDVKEAEERFKKGLILIDEGDCKNAVIEFEESYSLYPTAVVLYNMALCYDELHKYAKAMKYYRQYIEEATKVSEMESKPIKSRMKKLEKFLGSVKVTCNVDGASVLIDDEEIGKTPLDEIYVETGQHTLTVKKDNFSVFKEKLKMVSGKTVSVEAHLDIAEIEEDEGGEAGPGDISDIDDEKEKKKKLSPVIFWSMLGVTGALGAGAAVMGGLNVANHNKFKDTSYSDSDKWQDLKDKGETYNIAFLSLIGATGAAVVTTAVLAFFTDFKKKKKVEKKTVALSFIPDNNGGILMLTMPLDM